MYSLWICDCAAGSNSADHYGDVFGATLDKHSICCAVCYMRICSLTLDMCRECVGWAGLGGEEDVLGLYGRCYRLVFMAVGPSLFLYGKQVQQTQRTPHTPLDCIAPCCLNVATSRLYRNRHKVPLHFFFRFIPWQRDEDLAEYWHSKMVSISVPSSIEFLQRGTNSNNTPQFPFFYFFFVGSSCALYISKKKVRWTIWMY